MTSNSQNLRLRIRKNASLKEKTLIKLVAETLKKIVQLYQVKSCEDIFLHSDIQTLRYKLKACLDKLMFLDPVEFGQKAEDTIWKSIFYEPIRIFKKKLKSNSDIESNSILCSAFKGHILTSIGFYQSLIMRLVTELDLTVDADPEFLEYFPPINLTFSSNFNKTNNDTVSLEVKEWGVKCVERCLLYIGDLYRYEQEIKNPHTKNLARTYYELVLRLNPKFGHAYNQLATLDTLTFYGLTATFYYLKAQMCDKPFSQSCENLNILFERNIKRLRSVLDKEVLMKRSRHAIKRSNVRILKVKATIIKYLNVWYSLMNSFGITYHQTQQTAAICDEVLNMLSIVIGFDRKLLPETNAACYGIRPASLNSTVMTHILYIGCASFSIMGKEYQETQETNSDSEDIRLYHLAHSFLLNLFGHVLNQCLIRVRDEMRANSVDVSLLFRRHDNAAAVAIEQHEATLLNQDQVDSDEIKSDCSPTSADVEVKKKKKKSNLSRRLIRPLGDEEIDDLSEDGEYLSEDEHGLYEDELSSDSDGSELVEGNRDNKERKRTGFYNSDEEDDDDEDMFIDDDDEVDKKNDDVGSGFNSSEEIHSQDEDDQIIRAIVGPDTVFGRQNSFNKEQKSINKDNPLKIIVESTDTLTYLTDSQTNVKKSRSKLNKDKRVNSNSQIVSESIVPVSNVMPDLVAQCIYNVDLMQTISVMENYFVDLVSDKCHDDMSRKSFEIVWESAPYLWKHFAVILNFCENVLDDLDKALPSNACSHLIAGQLRKSTHTSFLLEDKILHQSMVTNLTKETVNCNNILHIVVTRLQRLLASGHSVAEFTNGPIRNQQSPNDGNIWLFSQSNNGPRAHLVTQFLNRLLPKQSTNTTSSTANIDREKLMRQMACLRLENEFSNKSDNEDDSNNNNNGDCDNASFKLSATNIDENFSDNITKKAVYLVPDVEFLCCHLNDYVRKIVRCKDYIIVVPQSVIYNLDKRKTKDHRARKVIKFFETELNIRNKHIFVESEPVMLPSSLKHLECPHIEDWASIEASVMRIANKTSKSNSKIKEIVLTVLTSSVSLLSDEFTNYYLQFGVNFKSQID